MAGVDFRAALREAQAFPGAIPDVVTRVARSFGANDVVLYLVDFAQTTLEPMPDRAAHADVPHAEVVVGSMAGRAFTDGTCVVAQRTGGDRVWAPIIEGSDRTGVLALTVPEATPEVVEESAGLGLLTGYLIATQARTTDLYNLHRRRRSLSLAASMQWDLLPPLVFKTPTITVAGALEPAYDVGGDCFDYALNDRTLHIGVFDSMGHDVASALIAALAVGSYRHDRRESRTLAHTHTNLDSAIARHCPALSFASGQLAQIDLDTGTLTWTNAGHPQPLLVRAGRVVARLECPPTPPWGLAAALGREQTPTIATESLEPGDSILFYTDGVIEAHERGEAEYGIDRLTDLTGRHASDELEPEEVVRLIVQSVLDYKTGSLADDATLVLVRWNPEQI